MNKKERGRKEEKRKRKKEMSPHIRATAQRNRSDSRTQASTDRISGALVWKQNSPQDPRTNHWTEDEFQRFTRCLLPGWGWQGSMVRPNLILHPGTKNCQVKHKSGFRQMRLLLEKKLLPRLGERLLYWNTIEGQVLWGKCSTVQTKQKQHLALGKGRLHRGRWFQGERECCSGVYGVRRWLLL